MNITQLAKLRAELSQDQLYTQHVRETSRPGQRAVRQIECWQREPRILGQGGMGKVYLERCIYSDIGSIGKARAVKVVTKSKEVQHERELEAVMLFSHEKYRRCFVESFGWYDTSEEIFIAMEYLPHGDLQQYLASQNAQIPESEVKVIVLQILEGLQYMHDLSITHRDIKPGNIMIVELGPTWWVKITDFGISKQCLDDLTALRTRAGTRYYTAPEVLEHILQGERGEHTSFSYTNAVDVWALGMTVYVLLLGELPFKDSSFQKLRDYSCGKLEFPAEAMREKGLSTDVYDFTKSLMAPQPGNRPSVADCFTYQWLEQFSTPIEDISDALTQALIDQDTQASRTWDCASSTAKAALKQQETARLHDGLPSRLPFSSIPSQDSGIYMPFDTPPHTAHRVPPQHAGQELPRQASEREPQQVPNEHLAPTFTRTSDVLTSREGPRHTLRARDWRMDKELKYDSGEIKALALSPDGTILVSGGDDKVIRVWNTESWTQAGMLHGHTGTITDLAFCPGGRWVLSASTDKTVRLWDVETLEPVSMVPGEYSAKVWAIAISPDGALLATGDGDGDVTIFALPSELAYAQGGTRVSVDEDRPLQKSLRSVRGNKGTYSLAFSPDGQLLASAGDDSNFRTHLIKIWNPHTMLLVATLNHKTWSQEGLYGVSFSRDGKMLASGSSDSIRLWDVATGVELKRCTTFDNRIFCAQFTFDGRLAFGDSESVVVWDAQAGEDPLVTFQVREKSWKSWIGVAKVISWPDGTFATAADTIKIWRPVTTVKQE